VVAFLKEIYIPTRSGFLPRSTLKIDYDIYCHLNDLMPMSPARLHEHLPGAATAAYGVGIEPGKRHGTRGFTGLGTRDG